MLSSSPKTATLMMRRSSAGLDGQFVKTTVPVRANFQDIREHLKHLGPSNPATNPNKTRSTTVKVKPGSGIHSVHPRSTSIAEATEETPMETPMEEEGDETTSLLKPSMSGKDGVHALRQSYGSVSPAITVQLAPQTNGVPTLRLDSEEHADKSTQTSAQPSLIDVTYPDAAPQPQHQQPRQALRGSSSGESATSMKTDNGLVPKRPYVRSGSITENVIESRGVRKVVLETTGSNDDEESAVIGPSSPDQPRLRGRGTFGLFGGRDSSKDSSKEGNKEIGQQQQIPSQPTPVEERDEEEFREEGDEGELMSPVPADREEEGAPGSYAEAAAKGTAQQGAQAGSSSGPSGGVGSGKKKNRRKKRKGGKS
jgi:metal transporter CNNM